VDRTGWTYREVDEHTLPEIAELMGYWKAHPPAVERLSAMVSAYFDVKWDGGGSPSGSEPRPGGWTLAEMAEAFEANKGGK